MNIFISGGCKNGKSYYAQRRAKELADRSGKALYYIATMIPHDSEDQARIKRHLAEREGWGFETIEQGRNLLQILDRGRPADIQKTSVGDLFGGGPYDGDMPGSGPAAPDVDLSGVFLLDSVTAILENEMYPVALKDRRQGKAEIQFLGEDETAPERVRQEMIAFAKEIAAAGGSVVFVSDGICGDMAGYSESTENYRRALAGCDRAIAEICDSVVEIAYGNEEIWK